MRYLAIIGSLVASAAFGLAIHGLAVLGDVARDFDRH
jgi:hypothetical protein